MFVVNMDPSPVGVSVLTSVMLFTRCPNEDMKSFWLRIVYPRITATWCLPVCASFLFPPWVHPASEIFSPGTMNILTGFLMLLTGFPGDFLLTSSNLQNMAGRDSPPFGPSDS